MGLQVRRAVIEDADRIGEVHVRSWQWAYDGLIDADVLADLSIPDRIEGWRKRLAAENETSATFVASRDGEVDGFVTVGAGREDVGGREVGEMVAIYIRPKAAGTGAGTALHEVGMSWLTEHGFSLARLWVLTGNVRARRFYERHGWRPDGETKTDDHSGAQLHETRYVRRLGLPPQP